MFMASAIFTPTTSIPTSWLCVGVVSLVMTVVIAYGIIRICRAVHDEVDQDTRRLLEQLSALDQFTSQCDTSEDLHGEKSTSQIAASKFRKFLEKDGSSDSSVSESSQSSSDDNSASSASDSDDKNQRQETKSKQTRTKSAIKRTYARPPSGKVTGSRKPKNVRRRKVMDVSSQQKIHPLNEQTTELENLAQTTSYFQVSELQTDTGTRACPTPVAWGDSNTGELTAKCNPLIASTVESIPEETDVENFKMKPEGLEITEEETVIVKSRPYFDVLKANSFMSGSGYASNSGHIDVESPSINAIVQKYAKGEASRPDSGYHK